MRQPQRSGLLRAELALALWLALFGAAAGAQTAGPQIGQVSRDSVWVPTPERVIRRMLQMADTSSRDLVIDLGSGDGRIPIYAAKHFGARAVGVELEANLVRLSRETAAAQGVSHLATFVEQDLFDADLSGASVIALYISPDVMTRLKPRLLQLRPGTRIVSHQFTLNDWVPDETIRVEDRSAHLWVVPYDVRGSWAVAVADDSLVLRFAQRYQELDAAAERGGKVLPVIGVKLRGTEIRFTTFDREGSARHFSGIVTNGRMWGGSQGQDVAPLSWRARFIPSAP